VRELVAELRPRVDVDQDVGEIDLRQPGGDLARERRRRGRPLGTRAAGGREAPRPARRLRRHHR
jgi:hypothetical protein